MVLVSSTPFQVNPLKLMVEERKGGLKRGERGGKERERVRFSYLCFGGGGKKKERKERVRGRGRKKAAGCPQP